MLIVTRMATRLKRAYLRRVMRGYRALKKTNQVEKIAILRQDLSRRSLGIDADQFSSKLFGLNGYRFSELILRQYLLVRLGDLSLNKALLCSIGKEGGQVIHPLPKCWRRTIEAHNFIVSNFWCALLWQLNIFLYFGFGVLRIIKISFSGLYIFKIRNTSENYAQYVYFDSLAEGSLPFMGVLNKNIFSWYSQWPGRQENSKIFRHSISTRKSQLTIGNVGIEFQESPIPSLVGAASRLKYICWGLQASLIAFLDIFRGRWWHAFLLNQAAILGQVINTKPHLLAREYLFHNSGWIYRPLWTYEAESLGSAISFYFYSTNCENFMKLNGETSIPYGWSAMSWPRYLVWDLRQAEFIKEVVGAKADISIVGDIWFLNGDQLNSLIPQNSVAVFDVQPVRDSFYYTLGVETEYYTPNTSIAFLSDIADSISNNNKTFVLKVKRQIGKLAHPKYRVFLQKLAASNNFINIDSRVSAGDIIAKSSAVISMPFTSTALLGRAAGKPSIYYDPAGLIQKNDPAAHGIPIVCGRKELNAWLSSI